MPSARRRRPSTTGVLLGLVLQACAGAAPRASERLECPPAIPLSVPSSAAAAPAVGAATTAPVPKPEGPLPSWNDGATKQAILDFVVRVTTPGGADFVPVPERIATFDNDGTLWSEQPIYIPLVFVIDRLRELLPQHPEWKTKEPFKSVLAGDLKPLLGGDQKARVDLFDATQSGITTDEFARILERWFSTAKHPVYGRLYTDCVYQPMLELLSFLRANGFKTFIVSGAGIDFMRPVTEKLYGIPPEQVIGTTSNLKFELRDGKPVIVRQPGISFVNDKDGKPIAIQTHIGRRPLAAFGNSDGDQQMLEWTAAGHGPRLVLLVHHTDAVREVAYDRASPIGKLDRALDEAKLKGWVVASMKDDWKTIFPPPSSVSASAVPAASSPPPPR